jgi:2-dehydro-3-deoxyphosphogluconate aldolase / (4S)-4-hydroxy-2-oxoglutarate aldolase
MAATQNSSAGNPVDVLRKHRINAIFTIDDARHAVQTARALSEAGIKSVEVTMRTPAALKSIERIAAEVPEVTVGAGTVLTPENVRNVKAAGGRFCIAPGFNPEMIDCCLENSLTVIPGVATPSEMESAQRHGLSVLKVYPIVPLGGVAFLKLVNGPFYNLEWVPSGGLTQEMLAEYLGYEKIVACGCTWFAPTDVIAAEKFDLIRETAARAVAAAKAFVRE